MDIEIHAPRDDEAEDVFALCSEAFTSPPEQDEPWRESKRMEDFLCVWSDGELVGTTEVMPGGQYFGGRSVPMGGVASVAVRPDQRGRGIAPRLLGQAVERMHEQGLVISTLHPATTRFYRGLGWEIGASSVCDASRPRCSQRCRPANPNASVPPGPATPTTCASATAESHRRSTAPSTAATRAARDGVDARPSAPLPVRLRRRRPDRRLRRVRPGSTGRQWGFGITVHELWLPTPAPR